MKTSRKRERLAAAIRNVYLNLILIHGLTCGVDLLQSDFLSPIRTNIRRAFIRSLRVVFVIVFVLATFGTFCDTYTSFPDNPGICDMFATLYSMLYWAIWVETLRTTWWNDEAIKKTFINSNTAQYFSIKRIFMAAIHYPYIMYLLGRISIYTTVHIESLAARNATILTSSPIWPAINNVMYVYEWNSLISYHFLHFIVIVYLQGLVNIRTRLAELRADLETSPAGDLRKRKAQIRQMIATANKIFSQLLFVMYAKIFAITYQTVVAQISNDNGIHSRRYRILASLSQIAVVYDTAALGSEIITSSRLTASALPYLRKSLFMQDSNGGNSIEELWRFSAEMAYDDVRDALTISDCFISHKGTLASFTGLAVTCMAILLQFDYKIMQHLEGHTTHG